MKKRILSAFLAVVMFICSGFCFGVAYGAMDFTPNTAVSYHDIGKYLFNEREFTTGEPDASKFPDGNWKYYYWCDFQAQYTANYTVALKAKKSIVCEIYDDSNNLLVKSNPSVLSNGYYNSTVTYKLEKEQKYYFKFYFDGNAFDACGRFSVTFISDGSDEISGSESIKAFVNSSTSYVYEKDDYSVSKLANDLSFEVTYKDGSVAKWSSKEHPLQALNGVDILFDFSDCKNTTGSHWVTVHYLGYETKVGFRIDDHHNLGQWVKQDGKYTKLCDVCGEVIAKLNFDDLDNYTYYLDYIAYTSYFNRIITGTNPPEYTKFSPNTNITRAMLIAIIYRMEGSPYDNGEKNPFNENPFTDVNESSYYYNAACWALKNQITTQVSFRPNSLVSREETASFLYRYADYADEITEQDKKEYSKINLSSYPDFNSVSSWAAEPMQWANYKEMIKGTSQGYLNPKGSTLRIHATKILYGFAN